MLTYYDSEVFDIDVSRLTDSNIGDASDDESDVQPGVSICICRPNKYQYALSESGHERATRLRSSDGVH